MGAFEHILTALITPMILQVFGVFVLILILEFFGNIPVSISKWILFLPSAVAGIYIADLLTPDGNGTSLLNHKLFGLSEGFWLILSYGFVAYYFGTKAPEFQEHIRDFKTKLKQSK